MTYFCEMLRMRRPGVIGALVQERGALVMPYKGNPDRLIQTTEKCSHLPRSR